MQLKCRVNHQKVVREIKPDLLLIDLVRDLGFKSVKRGCDTSNCGLCTVWVDEKPVLSCSVLAARVSGKKVTTLEGLTDQAQGLAKYIAAEGVEQCGYCSPGLMMTVLAMEKELKDPTDEQILHYLSGNLCRCSGYQGQLRAIRSWLNDKKNKGGENENG